MDEMVDRLLDILADKLTERLSAGHKELYTAKELAERYGVSCATIRSKMAAGEFGELVSVGERTRLVPWAGVQAYESAPWRCKPASGQIIQIFFLNQKIGDFAVQGFANQIKLFQRYPVGHLMVKIIDCVSPDSSCVCKLLLSPSLFA